MAKNDIVKAYFAKRYNTGFAADVPHNYRYKLSGAIRGIQPSPFVWLGGPESFYNNYDKEDYVTICRIVIEGVPGDGYRILNPGG